MNVSLKIALRYIFTKRNYHFISLITIISLIGISIGVAALIAVMSIFNGFQVITENQIIGFDPHIQITPKKGNIIKNSAKYLSTLKDKYNYKAIAPITTGKVVGINDYSMQVFYLNGIDENNKTYYEALAKTVIYGEFSIESNGLPKIVVGAQIAEKLRILPGDTINLTSPKIIEQSITSFRGFENIRAIVSGIFQSNIKDYDSKYAITSNTLTQKLFKIDKNSSTSIDIRLNSLEDFPKAKTILEKNMSGFAISSWRDLNKQLYKVMDFEKVVAFVIISIIVVIAVFNILASLTMTVIEKQNDIALLKAMGADNNLVRNIYLLEGIIIGIISIVAGSAMGLGFCYGQEYYKWFKIDGTKFIIDAVPVFIEWSDIIIIIAVTLIMTVLATIYPAIRAANTNLVSSIKSE